MESFRTFLIDFLFLKVFAEETIKNHFFYQNFSILQKNNTRAHLVGLSLEGSIQEWLGY